MRLFAAIVPPRPVLEELAAAARPDRAPAVAQPAPRGLLRRLSGRSSAPVASPAPDDDPELDRPTVDQMYLPITSFGNVTTGDAVKLANALRDEAETWRRPEVRFRGGAALEFPGDESVWAKLDGDIDALMTIGRGVPLLVQRLGFFVDRRQFRPWLAVGTITDHTTAPYLQEVVDALDAFEGRTWTVESVVLMKRPPESDGGGIEEVERMPLRA
jgi:RNA 2',3'-cyclic 3'-phosphodiesterase